MPKKSFDDSSFWLRFDSLDSLRSDGARLPVNPLVFLEDFEVEPSMTDLSRSLSPYFCLRIEGHTQSFDVF